MRVFPSTYLQRRQTSASLSADFPRNARPLGAQQRRESGLSQTSNVSQWGHRAMLSQLPRTMNWRARAGALMWPPLLACALLLLPAQALAGAREKL